MRRILILSAGIGSGHNSAAAAVADAVWKFDSSADILIIDTMSEYSERHTRLIYKYGYSASMSVIPKVYDRGYAISKNGSEHRRDSLAVMHFAEEMSGNIYGAIAEYDPGVICCTHFFPSVAVCNIRKKYGFSRRTIMLNLDYNVTPFWNSAADGDILTVAHKDLIPECRNMGFTKEKIAVTGIPTKEKFLSTYDKK